MTPPPKRTHTSREVPLVITSRDMQTAWAKGQVTPMHPAIPEFVHYLGHWWAHDNPEWVLITDDDFSQFLDQQHARMKDTIDFVAQLAKGKRRS